MEDHRFIAGFPAPGSCTDFPAIQVFCQVTRSSSSTPMPTSPPPPVPSGDGGRDPAVHAAVVPGYRDSHHGTARGRAHL